MSTLASCVAAVEPMLTELGFTRAEIFGACASLRASVATVDVEMVANLLFSQSDADRAQIAEEGRRLIAAAAVMPQAGSAGDSGPNVTTTTSERKEEEGGESDWEDEADDEEGDATTGAKRARGSTGTDATTLSTPPLPQDVDEDDCKMVICVRTDLGMGMGKACAQCAHAAVRAVQKAEALPATAQRRRWLNAWAEECGAAKIVVAISNQAALTSVVAECKRVGISSAVIQDAGRTQVDPGTRTVVAVGPAPRALVDVVTGQFKLL